MMNLLGIIGSPRKMGNCELMVKEISGTWLIGQREEFLRQRNLLKDAVKPYLGGEFL